MRVSRINIRCGSHIDQIQLVLTDGIQTVELSRHGGIGGSELNYTVPDGHRITKTSKSPSLALQNIFIYTFII